MVSQPGVGIDAARILKQLSGTKFDEKNEPVREKTSILHSKRKSGRIDSVRWLGSLSIRGQLME